jgi:hypothetical protein
MFEGSSEVTSLIPDLVQTACLLVVCNFDLWCHTIVDDVHRSASACNDTWPVNGSAAYIPSMQNDVGSYPPAAPYNTRHGADTMVGNSCLISFKHVCNMTSYK